MGTQVISPNARIGANCSIGDFVKIYDNVVLGDDCRVEDHCVLGLPTPYAKDEDLVIGKHAIIRPYSVLYAGSRIGDFFQTGTHVTIRERTRAGDGLRVGIACDVEGHNEIGDWVSMHSYVQIAQSSKIGDFVWMYPRVSLMDDPLPPSHIRRGVTIEDMAVICGSSLLLPGVTVGEGAFVSAASLVKTNVPKVTVVAGNPARVKCTLKELNRLPSEVKYPWHDHLADRYPASAQPRLREVGERIRALMNQS
jgi:acetyltransferase-like isoleucine patch superfamily enzyme